jgi:hypothetical protein
MMMRKTKWMRRRKKKMMKKLKMSLFLIQAHA